MDCESLARTLDLPRVVRFASIPSTMDAAHELAQGGAPGGTLVIADEQTRGRGRGGRVWDSRPGAGLWMTLIERPIDASGLEVLSLRTGLRAARVLDRFATAPVGIKWPNDLMLPAGKLAGILVEARWRGTRLEWVAVGIGINLGGASAGGVAALEVEGWVGPGDAAGAHDAGPGAREEGVGGRVLDVLGELVPALRAAAAGVGGLREEELEAFSRRDWARGRRALAPQPGTVVGISPAGALLIDTPDGTIACTSGSLRVEDGMP